MEIQKTEDYWKYKLDDDDIIYVHDYDQYKKYGNFILVKEEIIQMFYFMLFIGGKIYKTYEIEEIEDILKKHFKNEIRKDKLKILENYEK